MERIHPRTRHLPTPLLDQHFPSLLPRHPQPRDLPCIHPLRRTLSLNRNGRRRIPHGSKCKASFRPYPLSSLSSLPFRSTLPATRRLPSWSAILTTSWRTSRRTGNRWFCPKPVDFHRTSCTRPRLRLFYRVQRRAKPRVNERQMRIPTQEPNVRPSSLRPTQREPRPSLPLSPESKHLRLSRNSLGALFSGSVCVNPRSLMSRHSPPLASIQPNSNPTVTPAPPQATTLVSGWSQSPSNGMWYFLWEEKWYGPYTAPFQLPSASSNTSK